MESESQHFNYNSKHTVNIPVELIPNLSEKEKHLFNSVGILSNRLNDLDSKTDEQTNLLTKILEQTTATNGKVKDLRRDVDTLDKISKDIEPDIKSVKLAKKIVRTKYFWFTVGGLFLVVLPWISSTFPPKVIVAKVVDWFSGS